jgi:hypothetical protein
MQLFDFSQAPHFCRRLAAHEPGVGQSLPAFHAKLTTITRMREGSENFKVHRVSLLNAVERWILFGVADYRRALDMFIPSNAPWAQVTLYYSSFFAANAILGMFGVWVHLKCLVDVEDGTPSSQVLRIERKAKSPSHCVGSHRIFWDFFYEGYNQISSWVPPELRSKLDPSTIGRTWQIDNRNEVNYDMFSAFREATNFKASFNPSRLRKSLSGPLAQQLELTESMLKLALYFAESFDVGSFAFEGLGTGKRSSILRALVTKTPPGLTNQSVLQELLH